MKRFIQIALATTLMAIGVTYASGNMGDGKGMGSGDRHHKMMRGKKGAKKMRSVFLIQKGLPHYSLILKKFWDDPKLALTEKQKEQLLKIRKETIGSIKKLAPEALRLRRDIIIGSRNGEDLETLQKMADLLASIKAKATKIHLKCISETKAILTKEQIAYLQESMKKMRKMKKSHKAQMMNKQ